MAIDRATVDHVAWLARLALSDDEKERLGGELSRILDHVGKIGELDLTDVPPTSHSVPLKNVWREDVERRCLTREDALANAPESEEGAFTVPKII